MHIPLVHVRHIQRLLRGDETQRLHQLFFVHIKLNPANRLALVQRQFALAQDFGAEGGFLVSRTRQSFGFVERRADGLQIRQGQFGVDRVDIAKRIDAPLDVDNVPAAKAAHDVQNGIHLANVGEELIAKPFAGACAANDAGDIDDSHLRRNDFFGGLEAIDHRQPLIRHAHHAHVGLDGGEGIVRRQRPRRRECVEERAFTDVGKTDDANF